MQDLISNLPAVVYEYAFYPDGRRKFKYVSPQARDLLGLEPDKLLADPSNIYQVLRDGYEAFDTGGRSANDVVATVRLGAVEKQVRFSYRDEPGADGAIVRRGIIQEVATNGSPRNGVHEEIYDRLPIGVVIHHAGVVRYANRHALALIGAVHPADLIGRNVFEFVHQEFQRGIDDRIRQVAMGLPVPMVEEKFIRVDGRMIDVETMAFPFLYKGKPSIQVFFRDITEKKRAEARMRRSEIFFTQLFQNAPMAVVLLDGAGKVSEINRGFEHMFGYSIEELKGNNLNDFIVPEDLRSEGIDLNNLIATNRVVSIESIRRHKSGRPINVLLWGLPVIFDNQAIGIYGVYADITDRKKVEEELKVRNAELDNFVYKVSHDLRAPLSSVLGLVNLSRLQGNNDNPLEYIELIGEKIHALDNFIGDVLSHSKNLKMEVNVDHVDLQKIIEKTFTDLSYLKGARETRQNVRVVGCNFYSDHWRVSEIFRNLISNAIKYRKTNSRDSEISIDIRVDHLCADITFADNGIGINEASLKRIFEMFYRATEQGEGSGIGLYIVKNAVEKLGGQIKVASRPNEGTRFHILLPNRSGAVRDPSKELA